MNHPSQRPVSVPGRVSVPGNPSITNDEETSTDYTILAAIAVVLVAVLLLLLLLLLFLNKQPPGEVGGSGRETTETTEAGTETGTGGGSGDGIGSSTADGNEDRSGTDSNREENASPSDDSTESQSPPSQAPKPNENLSVTETPSEDASFEDRQSVIPADSATSASKPDDGDGTDGGGSGSGNGGGGNGSGVTVRVFGVGGHGSKFVYVFDQSASMAGQKMEEVKKELLRSLSVLNAKQQFNIIFYSDRFVTWRPGRALINAGPGEKKEAEEFVRRITSQGTTSHLPPLLEAIACKPDVIFFLTDGQSLTESELEEIGRKSGGIVINVIQYDDGRDGESDILRRLAGRHQGKYKYINVSTSDAL